MALKTQKARKILPAFLTVPGILGKSGSSSLSFCIVMVLCSEIPLFLVRRAVDRSPTAGPFFDSQARCTQCCVESKL